MENVILIVVITFWVALGYLGVHFMYKVEGDKHFTHLWIRAIGMTLGPITLMYYVLFCIGRVFVQGFIDAQ